MLYLVIFFILAVIVVWLLLLKINVLLEYLRKEWDDHLTISLFALGGRIKYKYEIPMLDIKKTGIKLDKVKESGKEEKDIEKSTGFLRFFELFDKFDDIKDLYEFYKPEVCDIRQYLKPRLVLKELKLDVGVGTGDAFYTGILSGFMWSVVGIVTSFLSNNFKILKKAVNVKTDFVEKKFKIDLYCIFNVKIVHIIVVAFKILFYKLKRNLKVVTKKWLNIQFRV